MRNLLPGDGRNGGKHLTTRRKANDFYDVEREKDPPGATSEAPAWAPIQNAAATEIGNQRLCRLREVAGSGRTHYRRGHRDRSGSGGSLRERRGGSCPRRVQ